MGSVNQTRLLVVDDEPELRLLLRRALVEGGYQVTLAANGSAAIEAAHREGFDACVCDIVMPGISGLDALRRLREIQPGLPVIVATGHASIESAVECLKEGAFDYLQKPFKVPDLLALVERAVEHRHLREKVDLYEASRRLLGCLDSQELASVTVELAMELLNADDGALLVARPDGAYVTACTRTSASVPTYDGGSVAAGVAARLPSWPSPEVIRDGLRTSPRFEGIPGSEEARSTILHPLAIGDRCVAVLLLNRIHVQAPFVLADVQRLRVLASQAALALENARIHEELRRRLEELERWGRQALQADKMAAIGMLAAGVAHEINNPLGFVISNVELLKENLAVSAPNLGEIANEALYGAQRIRVITRDLRSFSRTDEQEVDAVDINEAVSAAINIAHHQIKYVGSLIKDLAPELPTINGNPGRLGQVFLNLIINAAQALDPQATERNRVVVQTRRLCDRIEVRVSDTGCGIAEENLQRLFMPFFTTKPRGVGTGLGLSICQDIVRQHRGAIRVESRVGEGTTFTVTIPIETGRVRTTTPMVVTTSAASRPGRVLLIDDEPMLANAYRRMLEREHDVRVVSDGHAAIALLSEDPGFDVVFCDLMMPNVSGIAVYRAAVERRPELAKRFVFMTGGAFTAEARSFLDSIDNLRLDKPIDVDTFRNAIAGHVSTTPPGVTKPPPG